MTSISVPSHRSHLAWTIVALAIAIGFSNGHLRTLIAQGPPDPCTTSPINPIACENSKPGNPASEWDISGAGSASIQGFTTDISAIPGETVRFKVDTTATAFRIDIYRLGYYGGQGARKIDTIPASATVPRSQPDCLTDSGTGLIDCGNWSQSASWVVPAGAVSGIYVAKPVVLRGRRDQAMLSSWFVMMRATPTFSSRHQTRRGRPTTSFYGGNSLYVGSPAGRA